MKLIVKEALSSNEAINEALKTPVIGVAVAAAIHASTMSNFKRYRREIISGPICGSRIVKNGRVSDIVL